jgi:hypothetical protein
MVCAMKLNCAKSRKKQRLRTKLSKHRLGKEHYYLNEQLYQLLLNVGQQHGS